MTTSGKPSWTRALRALIKTEHGFGWSIRGHRGKVQLTRRFEDGTRSAMSLNLTSDASCQTGVVNAVGEIRQRMDAHGLGLAEAYGLICSAPTAEQAGWTGRRWCSSSCAPARGAGKQRCRICAHAWPEPWMFLSSSPVPVTVGR